MIFLVTVYTVDGCGFCEELLNFLRERGVPYNEIRLNKLNNSDLDKALPEIDGAMATPVTIVDGEKLVGASQEVKQRILCKTIDKNACIL